MLSCNTAYVPLVTVLRLVPENVSWTWNALYNIIGFVTMCVIYLSYISNTNIAKVLQKTP